MLMVFRAPAVSRKAGRMAAPTLCVKTLTKINRQLLLVFLTPTTAVPTTLDSKPRVRLQASTLIGCVPVAACVRYFGIETPSFQRTCCAYRQRRERPVPTPQGLAVW